MLPANRQVVHVLREQGCTLALAESMTCGLAAHSLASVKGVSEVLIASAVCYHESAKKCLLNIPNTLIKKHTAESQQVTDRMVRELKRLVVADIYAAITGLASPGGSESKQKPVGTVFFSVLYRNKLYRFRKEFNGTSIAIRRKSCNFLFEKIIELSNS